MNERLLIVAHLAVTIHETKCNPGHVHGMDVLKANRTEKTPKKTRGEGEDQEDTEG